GVGWGVNVAGARFGGGRVGSYFSATEHFLTSAIDVRFPCRALAVVHRKLYYAQSRRRDCTFKHRNCFVHCRIGMGRMETGENHKDIATSLFKRRVWGNRNKYGW